MKTPPPFEIARHLIRLTDRFRQAWASYYQRRPELEPPPDKALSKILKQCYWAEPGTVGIEIVGDRVPFRHPDYDGFLFLCKLEGVTDVRPVGEVVFVSMVPERPLLPTQARVALGLPDRVAKLEETVALLMKMVQGNDTFLDELKRRLAGYRPAGE